MSLQAPTARKPSWVIAGVVLVALAALLGAYVFNIATDTIRVTVANGTLEPGDPIGPEDLRVVEMGRTNELRAIVADQQSLIIGLTPRAEIPDGTVLNTDLFVPTAQVIPAGQVVVGAAFEPGAVPTASLAVGQTVSVLVVEREVISAIDADGAPAEAALIGTGTIWSIEGSADDNVRDETWLSVLVDADLETRFAQAASEGRIRLSLVGA